LLSVFELFLISGMGCFYTGSAETNGSSSLVEILANGYLANHCLWFCTTNSFQVIFQAVQFICCDLQIIYDQSFCYLCVGAGHLCLHRIVFQVMYGNQIFVSQIVINHTFVF
jgi:hypothetical protein